MRKIAQNINEVVNSITEEVVEKIEDILDEAYKEISEKITDNELKYQALVMLEHNLLQEGIASDLISYMEKLEEEVKPEEKQEEEEQEEEEQEEEQEEEEQEEQDEEEQEIKEAFLREKTIYAQKYLTCRFCKHFGVNCSEKNINASICEEFSKV